MKKLLLLAATACIMVMGKMSAQAPVLGTSAHFALFSSNGSVTNTGISIITGDVGTNNGSATNFGNVNGVMHDADGITAIAAADLIIAYNRLNAAIPHYFPAALLGNGQTLTAGTYSIGQTASLNNTLTLDGGGNANSVFIFKIGGAFSSSANAQVILKNGATACNVFWKIEGLVDLATNTAMKGTIVANNAAIILNTGVTLEGRALSTTGAVTVAGISMAKPLGCGTPVLTGPASPALNSVACYTVFSGNGAVTNAGISFITGDVGTNVGLTTGFQTGNVTGTIHAKPDVSTATCAADLNNVYTYLKNGAVSLNDYADFKGTVIGNNGAVIINTGVKIEARVLSTSGGISTFGIEAVMTPGCTALSTSAAAVGKQGAKFFPNPFSTVLNVAMDDTDGGSNLVIFNAAGSIVAEKELINKSTAIPMKLPAGIYFYHLKGKNGAQQRGKLIAKP